MSIATEITRLQTAKANLKTSLEAKGATIASDATIDTYPTVLDDIPVCTLQDKEVSVSAGSTTTISPDSGYTGLHEVEVTAVSGIVEKTVNFYDFDGTLVASYTGQEAQALTELPVGPDHSADEVPLTFEEWNWTLSEIKVYNTSYPEADINVGANYHTTDNKFHLIVNITTGDNIVQLYNKGGSGTIDWGDSTVEVLSSNSIFSHTYNLNGRFNISLKEDNSDNPLNIIVSDNTNVNKTNLNTNLIEYYESTDAYYIPNIYKTVNLSKISLSKYREKYLNGYATIKYSMGIKGLSVPRFNFFNTNNIYLSFEEIYNLEHLIIPPSFDHINKMELKLLYNLKSITATSYLCSFDRCYSLKKLVLPEGFVANASAFKNLALKTLNLPSTWNSNSSYYKYSRFGDSSNRSYITKLTLTPSSISPVFLAYIKLLEEIVIPEGITKVLGIKYMDDIKKIVLPSTLTTLGDEPFTYNPKLEFINIPDSITEIPGFCFSSSSSLYNIELHSGILTIGAYAFPYLKTLTIHAITPPSIQSNSFNNNLTRIYVPYSSDHSILSAYQSETNWVAYASKMEELPAS